MKVRQIYVAVVCAAVWQFSFGGAFAAEAAGQKPPEVGTTIADFEFSTLDHVKLRLADLTAKGPLVLVVLRGYPGYQCPVCTKQVADLRKQAKNFEALNANVLLVYPGGAEKLGEHAEAFLKNSKLPKPMVLVTDPDYKFIEQLNLRWNMPGETAYPSTFILDRDRKVTYAKVSKSHGDRAKPEVVLDALRAVDAANARGQDIPQDSGIKVGPPQPRR